jgi:hypothetical protein
MISKITNATIAYSLLKPAKTVLLPSTNIYTIECKILSIEFYLSLDAFTDKYLFDVIENLVMIQKTVVPIVLLPAVFRTKPLTLPIDSVQNICTTIANIIIQPTQTLPWYELSVRLVAKIEGDYTNLIISFTTWKNSCVVKTYLSEE